MPAARVAAGGVCLVFACSALGQAPCGSVGADLVISHIEGIQNYLPSSGVDAVAFATRQTNIGTVSIAANLQSTQHPVQAPNLYRHTLSGGVSRFEQVGMGWCFHAGIPLNMGGYCTCQGGGISAIGPGCSDPHSAAAAGSAQNLGPRWEIDPYGGGMQIPHGQPVGPLPGLVRFVASDVEPLSNPDSSFFAELVVVHGDEDASHRSNNATWRPLAVSGVEGNPTLTLTGATHPGEAAIQAWKSLVPGVTEAALDVPGDGRYIFAARAVRVGGNLWNYEYAIFNLNAARAAGAFVLPRPAGMVIRAAGFHDVDYDGGDGPEGLDIVGVDWTLGGAAGELRWETEPFDINPAANALRWGTMYNFRVTCNAAPIAGEPTLELFVPGEPGVLSTSLPVPGGPSCLGDHDGNGSRDVTDIFAFLSDWFARNASGDADGDGTGSVPDIFTFLSAWFAGC